MKLLFKRGPWLEEYHGNGIHFQHGEEQEVPDKEAEGLLRDFPANFSPVSSAALDRPPVDKQIKAAVKKDRSR